MSIWHEKFTLNHVISLRNNNLNKHLGIEFIELGSDYIVARMPVEDHTRQSRGILHGGASCVLAEALGSIASNMCIDMRKQKAVIESLQCMKRSGANAIITYYAKDVLKWMK